MVTLDLLIVTPVFEEPWTTRERYAWRDRTISVVSRRGLTQMKLLAARLKDLADLEALGLNGETE